MKNSLVTFHYLLVSSRIQVLDRMKTASSSSFIICIHAIEIKRGKPKLCVYLIKVAAGWGFQLNTGQLRLNVKVKWNWIDVWMCNWSKFPVAVKLFCQFVFWPVSVLRQPQAPFQSMDRLLWWSPWSQTSGDKLPWLPEHWIRTADGLGVVLFISSDTKKS